MLQTLDALWKDHLLSMDHLKEGIGLRGYGQVNPLQEYQKEGYAMFEDMIRRMEADVVEKLMSVQIRTEAAGVLPMGSLYEAVQLLFFDVVSLRLRERLGQSAEEMRARHTNLE